jgi:hypothetical protein
VNARTGGILSRYDNLASGPTGRGLVFDPSPVIALGGHTTLLKTKKKVRRPPPEAYRQVKLLELDGKGFLSGRRVSTSPTGKKRVKRLVTAGGEEDFNAMAANPGAFGADLDAKLTIRLPVTAGEHVVTAATILKSKAPRLSFFLWSSIPDDQLLTLASQGKLKNPATLDQQVRRMIADPRSNSLIANFAEQWLFLRNLKSGVPDLEVFPDFDAVAE